MLTKYLIVLFLFVGVNIFPQSDSSIVKRNITNDLVGDNRLMNFVSDNPVSKENSFLNDYREYVILRMNKKPVPLCNANFCPIEYHLFADSLQRFTANTNDASVEKIVNGRRYLNKNYYRLLVMFKLEYKILFESLRKLDSVNFDSLKIITQGYDYICRAKKLNYLIKRIMNSQIILRSS